MRKLSTEHKFAALSDEDLLLGMESEYRNKYLGELYKRYAHLVYGICMKYLKNKSSSKDLMMEIFEKLLNKLLPKTSLSFKHWLFTVTKHQCLTFLRNSSRSNEQQEKWEIEEKRAANFMEIEEDRSLNNRTQDETPLLDALKQLKEPQKICMRLFYIEGRSYKEIEQKTEYTLNEIKSYLQNGKRKLKLLIERKS